MDLKYKKFWLVLGFLLIAIIVQQTLTASPIGVTQKISDKFLHVVGYFLLMGWFVQIFQPIKVRLLLAVIFIFMGVSLEFLQGLSGIRQYEINDMLANSLGVVLAWVFAFTSFSKLLYKIDKLIYLKINSKPV